MSILSLKFWLKTYNVLLFGLLLTLLTFEVGFWEERSFVQILCILVFLKRVVLSKFSSSFHIQLKHIYGALKNVFPVNLIFLLVCSPFQTIIYVYLYFW